MKCGVIIPAYNVGETLHTVLSKTQDFIPQQYIYVVDDGSTDETKAILQKSSVKTITLDRNRGKGVAMRAGIQRALQDDLDALITLDGDGQHDPAEIPLFMQTLEKTGSDAVFGYRQFRIGVMPIDRILSNSLTSWIVSKVTGHEVPDSQCGYRMYRTTVLRSLEINSKRFEVETEMLIKTLSSRYQVSHCPVTTTYHGNNSHIRRIPDTIRFCRLILQRLIQKK
ncbi:glycosyltransferase family 2 protein [candidate division KSB1 bacterium]|nr:glycosyltransferase family 2 protein [candidate division KSB1 bacterium]